MTTTNLITNKKIQKELHRLQNSMKHQSIENSNAVISFLGNNKIITPLKRVIDLTKDKTEITTLSKALQLSALYTVKEFSTQEELAEYLLKEVDYDINQRIDKEFKKQINVRISAYNDTINYREQADKYNLNITDYMNAMLMVAYHHYINFDIPKIPIDEKSPIFCDLRDYDQKLSHISSFNYREIIKFLVKLGYFSTSGKYRNKPKPKYIKKGLFAIDENQTIFITEKGHNELSPQLFKLNGVRSYVYDDPFLA